jgi:cytochrome P450
MKIYYVLLIAIFTQLVAAKEQLSFLEELDQLPGGQLPFVGQLIRTKDPLKHRLRVMTKWQKKNPMIMHQELRNNRPIAKLSSIPNLMFDYRSPETVLVSKREDVIQIFSQPSIFTVQVYGNRMKGINGHMLSTDETSFNLIEKPWMRKLMPREDAVRIEVMLTKISEDVLTEIQSQKTSKFNLVKDYARKIPAIFSEKYFGFPAPDLKTLYRWSKTTQRNYFHNILNNPLIRLQSNRSEKEMIAYGKQLILKIKNNPTYLQDTILAKMLRSNEVSEKELTEERVLINIIGAFVGSIETTQTAFINVLEELYKRPNYLSIAQKAAQDNDLKLLAQIAWEALRFNPINPMMIRYVTKDVTFKPVGYPEVEPVHFKKGSTILLGLQSAMFDESLINKPNKFMLNRNFDTYFHFGYGHHRCLGEMINMIQIPLMLKQVLKIKNFKVHSFRKKGSSPFPENIPASI